MKPITLVRGVGKGLALADASFPVGLGRRSFSGPPLPGYEDEGGSINLATESKEGQPVQVTVEVYASDEPKTPLSEPWFLNGDSATTRHVFRRTTSYPLTLRSFDEEVMNVALEVAPGNYEYEVWAIGREEARQYWSQYHLPPLPLQEQWIIRLWPSTDPDLDSP